MSHLNFNITGKDNDALKIKAAVAQINVEKDPFRVLATDLGVDVRAILVALHHVSEFFKSIQENPSKLLAVDSTLSVHSSLKGFLELLLKLQRENYASKIDAALMLSKHWHAINDYFALLPKAARKGLFYQEGSLWLQSLNLFPTDEDKSFGFYLKNLSGDKWLPFPYMKIITRLHDEYHKEGKDSHLEIWSKTLEHLIELLSTRKFSAPQTQDETVY